MRLTDKRIRHMTLALALIVTCVLVWWARVYAPFNERADDLDMDLSRLSLQRYQLRKELKRRFDILKGDKKVDARLERLSRVIGQANSLEEADAMIQAKLQAFLEKHEIPLNAYKELPPGKWQAYQVGRVEFQLSATTQDLAALLQFLENQEVAVRIERLQINSRRRKGSELQIRLRLGLLFVKGAMEKPQS